MGRKENAIYHTLKSWAKRDAFLHVHLSIWYHRFETGSTELGVPDVFFECGICPGWIELKDIVWPKRESTKIKIDWRPLQMQWLQNNMLRTNNNSVAFLAVIDNHKQIWFFDKDHLQEEYTQQEFLEHGFLMTNTSDVINFIKREKRREP